MTGTSVTVTHEWIWCGGCGRTFKGARGLRVHQTSRFVSVSCRPMPVPLLALAGPDY